jgi:WhiB family redox-sensing transcriptional regulator
VRLFERTRTADIDSVLARYRSPATVDSLPTAGVTPLGLDLVAIDRALSGEHPQPALISTEARLAFALLRNPMELWASEIATALNVHVRSVVRWRQATPPIPTAEGGDMNPGTPVRWRDAAHCGHPGTDPELWYPLGYTRDYQQQIEDAQAVCARCPVMALCREDALRTEGGSAIAWRHGIRGGLTPTDRHTLHRNRVRKAREVAAQAAMETAA